MVLKLPKVPAFLFNRTTFLKNVAFVSIRSGTSKIRQYIRSDPQADQQSSQQARELLRLFGQADGAGMGMS